jgi:ATP/maltotriose-dependent transcriptional regulator MalT
LATPGYVFAATATLAMAAVMAGRTADAARWCDEARRRIDALPDAELADRLVGAQFVTLAEMYLERMEPIVAHAERALAIAQRFDERQLVPVLSISHAYGAGMVGRMDDAARTIEDAVEAARLLDTPFDLSWVLFNQASIAALAGDRELALTAAEESVELASRVDDNIVGAFPSTALGDALLLAGNPARAAEAASAHAGAIGSQFGRAWADRARARVELERGDPQAAARHALASAEALAAGGAVAEAARSRT